MSSDTLGGLDVQLYTYTPLAGSDTIRLIELHPGPHNSLIHCSLVSVILSDCSSNDIYGHYTALSYVWGSPAKDSMIWIDDRQLQITSSLHSALRDLRHKSVSLWIWADGICINQEDGEEKVKQIGVMGKIYEGALHTVIYLGPEDGHTESSIMALSTWKTRGKESSADAMEPILSKEWFNRVWVFQELVFSKSPWIHLKRGRNDKSQRFQRIMDMDRARTELLGRDGTIAARAAGLSSISKWQEESNTMLRLLQGRRGMGVTDPRDMIFAHMGFAFDNTPEGVRLDYSVSVQELYGSFAKYVAREYGVAKLLSCVDDRHIPSRFMDLPSWVPDWTAPTPKWLFYNREYTTEFSNFTLIPMENEDIIACKVEESDAVLFVSEELLVDKIPKEFREKVILKLVNADIEAPVGGSISTNLMGWKEIQEVWPDVYEAWRLIIANDLLLPADPMENDIIPSAPNLRHRSSIAYTIPTILTLVISGHLSRMYISGKVLARLASGNLALLPAPAEVGDLVVPVFETDAQSQSYRNCPDLLFQRLYALSELSKTDEAIRNAIVSQDHSKVHEVTQATTVDNPDTIEDFKNISFRDSSVVHCKFVSGCFRDVQYDKSFFLGSVIKTPKRIPALFLMALH
ncbi:Heterokaryon incompatibility protein 6 OR allele [Lachnellula suecica]|uniref:Heterokaryon incompatibility protein 6 OR allele n=1 Tax=Lachnellula suecica TaxID=602035 RepID=A0A8T9C1N4_9HELO|nr:Heterokaryon incompatibility protein 6 OR allele [Lachnellula suecica]